jgi:hypothetical protein
VIGVTIIEGNDPGPPRQPVISQGLAQLLEADDLIVALQVLAMLGKVSRRETETQRDPRPARRSDGTAADR